MMRLFTHYWASHLCAKPQRHAFTREHLAVMCKEAEVEEPVALGRTDALTLVNRWNRRNNGWVRWVDGDDEH